MQAYSLSVQQGIERMKVLNNDMGLAVVAPGGVLTIGNFDGLHLGHREILKTARKRADAAHTRLGVMTFEPHPIAALRPELTPGVLTPLPYKIHLLEDAGVDYLFVAESTPELLGLQPEYFVRRFLIEHIRPHIVVEGHDFNFGAKRAGDVDTLRHLGHQYGFTVKVVPPKEVKMPHSESVRVSSTVIRSLLESGAVSEAAIALGRPYRLIGPVIPGRGKGRHLGFPTANMEKPQQVIPAEGVYAGYARFADDFDGACTAEQKHPAAFSIGRSCTFGPGTPLLIEAHVLEGNIGPLNEKHLAMDFIKRIRGQMKFNSEKDLTAQIEQDCNYAKKILME